MPWLSHVNGSYFAFAEALLMVLREVLLFVEEHCLSLVMWKALQSG